MEDQGATSVRLDRNPGMVEEGRRRFEELMIPHLDAAYNFALWLVRNKFDAEDIVQDAYVRAFRFFGSFKGTNAKPWLLAVVRNSYRNFAAQNRIHNTVPLPDDGDADTLDERDEGMFRLLMDADPERRLIEKDRARVLEKLVGELPVDFREIIILREFEDMPYKTIAEIVDVPIGTVMSRLARARALLREQWNTRIEGRSGHDVR